MKILGLISDTHIPTRGKDLPSLVLKTFEKANMIIHAGDFEELSVADNLQELAPLVAVHGNMCYRAARQRFPELEIIEVESLRIGITHGSGGSSGYLERVAAKFKDEKVDIVVCGHTHQPSAEMHQDRLFINPGSPIDKVFARRNTIAILRIDGKKYNYEFIEIQ